MTSRSQVLLSSHSVFQICSAQFIQLPTTESSSYCTADTNVLLPLLLIRPIGECGVEQMFRLRTVVRKTSIGGIYVCVGGLNIEKLLKTPLTYRISYFNLGGLVFCLGV